ncbi:DUF3596 domain-containing protein [Agarivorans sp. B2Z047]|uniref:Arm DNA-binding domain-containing protein n=1 Tax=Agarivorans sp. B2Z047 TaxID=2652721 RepID=UPI00128CDF87|nr:DUF3596 domain-containing protein [Agarivorans sp. B2Z047]MPW31787.1 DUF3596 domain-containing protein [Agarivorans sp. B2Z047]UQN44848.1 DUF3596 domain-containing protein [Agarivorans sp. B2Z047]
MDPKLPTNVKKPPGVEIHGGYVRIWFMYKGERCRESLTIPPTKANLKKAGEKRAHIVYQIKHGEFDYEKTFPESKRASRFAPNTSKRTVHELSIAWLDSKRLDLSNNTFARYSSVIKTVVGYLGKDKICNTLINEDFSNLRNSLQQAPQNYTDRAKAGRTVRTVNVYLTIAKQMLEFGHINNYLLHPIWYGVKQLKKTRVKPDPLSHDEFERLLSVCRNEQDLNFFTVAVYTGLRHGELISLAWEDIDLMKGEVTISRNLASIGEFVQPKTESSERVIKLLSPAKQALMNQQALTKMYPAEGVMIQLREKGAQRVDMCTFVFNPLITAKGEYFKSHYSNTSIEDKWTRLCKRSGVRRRPPIRVLDAFKRR